MKVFSGCFNKAETFRYELQKGAPDSIFAIFAFLALALLSFIAFALTTIWLVSDRETVGMLIKVYLSLVAVTFIYNVVKAAFECFLAEREDLIERLKQ